MFTMTSNVEIGKYEKIPVSSCTWVNSIESYTNRAEIVVPGIVTLKKNNYSDNNLAETLPTSQVFTNGLPVVINAGYNHNNDLRFIGFVATTFLKDKRLVIKCEGYSYPLRKVVISKSWKSVLLKDLLKELVKDTPVKVSPLIEEIELKNIFFKKRRATDVLDYLSKKCSLTVCFNNEELYVGLKYTQTTDINGDEKKPIKFRVGYNIIETDNLIFKDNSDRKVSISVGEKDGSKTVITSGDGEKEEINIRHIKNSAFLQKLYRDLMKGKTSGSYSGGFTAFAEPFVKPCDVIILEDDNYKLEKGKYFISEVEGSISTGGFRQSIKIDIKLSDLN